MSEQTEPEEIEARLRKSGTYQDALQLLRENKALREDLSLARGRVAELEKWVADLQSGMWVNCVYCGHRYGPGETTPVSMADALKAHIEQCPKHPMSELKAKLDKALETLKSSVAIADEAALEWDRAPEGMRAGKILLALAGRIPGYRKDTDAIHSVLKGGK